MAQAPHPKEKWTKKVTPSTEHIPLGKEAFLPFEHHEDIPDQYLREWLNTLEITPISAVKWNGLGGWYADSESKENDVLYFLVGGPAWFACKPVNKHQLLYSGTGLFVPRGIEFSARPYQGKNVVIYSIHFFASVLRSVEFLKLLNFPREFSDTQDGMFEQMCESMCREFVFREPGWELAVECGLTSLILHFLRHTRNPFSPYLNIKAMDKLHIISPALDYIENNFNRQDLQIHEIADSVSMSEGHFRRLFLQTMGHSPIHWIQKRRIDLACLYLKRDELSIQEISELCGFKTHTFFYRIFQKWTGQTPAHFRKSNRL